jgi:DUF4097 and DUF4098 domain-containing protein YvlB
MRRFLICAAIAATVVTATVLSGCATEDIVTGVADRSFTVNGPVRLEVQNASGQSRITAGPPGVVRVHAEFRVSAWSWDQAQSRLRELQNDPPISDDGNVVRLSAAHWGWAWPNASVDYDVTVPPRTELQSSSASGNVNALGISGPMDITVVSGDVSAQGIAGDTRAHAVSGNIRLFDVRGSADVSTVSGSVDVDKVQGYLRAHNTSGPIWIERPAGDVEAEAVSGGINITDATGDLRAKTISGGITVEGSPGPGHFWDIDATSGSIVLRVPPTASIRLHAHSASGHIDVDLPGLTWEGDRHSLQARIGDGAARVEIGTFSGGISIH